MLNVLLYILGFMLISVILLQAPKQETLGNAFSNIHKTRVEKVLTVVTYSLFGVICLVLIGIRFI